MHVKELFISLERNSLYYKIIDFGYNTSRSLNEIRRGKNIARWSYNFFWNNNGFFFLQNYVF